MADVTLTVAAETPANMLYAVADKTTLPTIASLAQAATGLTDAQLDDLLILVSDIRQLLINAGIAA